MKKWMLGIAAGVGAAVAAQALIRRNTDDSLNGLVVVITGGSRGLGLALAREFARRGCRLALCARNTSELASAQQELESRGAEALTVECDVGDRQQVERLAARILEHYGSVDILVNNAGEIQVGPVESMTIEDFERAMQIMFWGTVHTTLAFLPHFTSRKSGRIVNITSIGGKVAVPHLLPYTCAKFAAVGFSEGLYAELKESGIRVVTIAPGLMRTGGHVHANYKGDAERESAWFGMSATMPGLAMSPERAARQIVDAVRRGDAEKVLSTPAKALAGAHNVAPGLIADILALANRWLLPAAPARQESHNG